MTFGQLLGYTDPAIRELLVSLAKRNGSKDDRYWYSLFINHDDSGTGVFQCLICGGEIPYAHDTNESYQACREEIDEHAMEHLKEAGLLAFL
jgi:hypothetical protein